MRYSIERGSQDEWLILDHYQGSELRSGQLNPIAVMWDYELADAVIKSLEHQDNLRKEIEKLDKKVYSRKI